MGGLRFIDEAEAGKDGPSSLFSEVPGTPEMEKSSGGAFSNWIVLPTPPIFGLREPLLQLRCSEAVPRVWEDNVLLTTL